MPGVVALTYDDGPCGEDFCTPRLLDILKANNVTATFYVIGSRVEWTWVDNRAPLLRAHNESHLIASHTYSHSDLTGLSDDLIREEIVKTDMVIESVIPGYKPRFLRPPTGAYNADVTAVLTETAHRNSMWNLDTEDWSNPYCPECVINNVRNVIAPSNPNTDSFVILMHDIYENSVDVTEEIIDIIKAKGYRFVRMDECVSPISKQ